MRMIKQGAVKIDGEKVSQNVKISSGTQAVFQVGKRQFARISLKK
jgi:tyrosyl-tRNA synthetase